MKLLVFFLPNICKEPKMYVICNTKTKKSYKGLALPLESIINIVVNYLSVYGLINKSAKVNLVSTKPNHTFSTF